jgi:hypothetical protein
MHKPTPESIEKAQKIHLGSGTCTCYGTENPGKPCRIHGEIAHTLDDLVLEIERLKATLEWYAERARSIKRYLEMKDRGAVPLVAILTELSLDNGARAAAQGGVVMCTSCAHQSHLGRTCGQNLDPYSKVRAGCPCSAKEVDYGE